MLTLCPWLLLGCADDVRPEVVVEAHRGAAAYWSENSRSALLGSIAAGYEGIEFDVVLTADHVPVLSHDPTVNPHTCTTLDGEGVPEGVLIMDFTLEELQDTYLCGGIEDPEFPDAELLAESHMTFDELLVALEEAGDPRIEVHIDVKFEPGETPEADAFAVSILDAWRRAELPNPWFVSANLTEALEAFTDYGYWWDLRVPTSLIWPRFTPDVSSTATGLKSEVLKGLGLRDLVGLAEEAGADGIAVPYQLVDRGSALEAQELGVDLRVWTLNSPKLLETWCTWPIGGVITDTPDDAPCG